MKKKMKNKKAPKSFTASENRRIAKENKKFEKMSPSQKRVQIARDVLAQLASKRLIAAEGFWLGGELDHYEEPSRLFSSDDLDENPDLQDLLRTKKECTGCALGGMFMCAVERADKLKLNNLSRASKELKSIQEYDVFKYMRKYFSNDQLNKIEAAFEQGEGARDQEEANEWLDDVDDASLRMRLIMENIVANEGKFTLSKKPEQVWVTPGFEG